MSIAFIFGLNFRISFDLYFIKEWIDAVVKLVKENLCSILGVEILPLGFPSTYSTSIVASSKSLKLHKFNLFGKRINKE